MKIMEHIQECRILLVDDHPDILEMLKNILRKRGFVHLRTADCCAQARELFREFKPELVILDIMLPDGDGFSLMRDFRCISDAPVLFLSAKDEDNDRLLGLGLGADDYITKPFLPDELILRMTAILRRTYFSTLRQGNEPSQLTLGNRIIHLQSGMVSTKQGELMLTAKELALLNKLNENRGNIVTFDALSDAVWGENYYGYENTLMVHIRRLREKIEEHPSAPVWLLTVRGLGYKLVKEAASPNEKFI
jgi:DNA-binding response OmpR family regulator